MTPDALLTDDWTRTIERLGGSEALTIGARKTKAFAWGRKIPTPVVLLRLVLAYCLDEWGPEPATGLDPVVRPRPGLPPSAWRTFPTSACCIACGGAATGWPCWSVTRSPPASRTRAMAA
jgi:hypothetical protein